MEVNGGALFFEKKNGKVSPSTLHHPPKYCIALMESIGKEGTAIYLTKTVFCQPDAGSRVGAADIFAFHVCAAFADSMAGYAEKGSNDSGTVLRRTEPVYVYR